MRGLVAGFGSLLLFAGVQVAIWCVPLSQDIKKGLGFSWRVRVGFNCWFQNRGLRRVLAVLLNVGGKEWD